MKKTGFNGNVFDFSVDYDATEVDDIVDIHKYLMKNTNIELTISSSFASVNSLNCISMSNQECKTTPQVFNVNGDEPVYFPFCIKSSKCSGSCNNINHPYAKICVPDVVKSLNIKVFNLMSRTNGTRHIEWHETCKCE